MGDYCGLTVECLRKLMQFNGEGGVCEVNKLGGVEEICEKLGSSPKEGIGNSVEHRRATFGSNKIPSGSRETSLRDYCGLLWNVFCDPTIVMLIIFCGLAILCQSFASHFPIYFPETVCVVIIIVITFIANCLCKRRFERLLNKVSQKHVALVIRSAVAMTINVEDVVVGDVCVMSNDDVVPADGIVLESNELKLDESSLTGNSSYVNKSLQLDPMLLRGTKVVDGSGTMLTVAVGTNTRKGFLFTLLAQKDKKMSGLSDPWFCDNHTISFGKEKSVIQQKVFRLFKNIIYGGVAIAALVFIALQIPFMRHHYAYFLRSAFSVRVRHFFLITMFMFILGLPQSIPVAVPIVLIMTVRKLFRDNKLVRNLHSSETMGNVTSICFDKTGTLTTNRMEIVRSFICDSQHAWDSDGFEDKSLALRNNTFNLIAENISINSSSSSMVTYSSDNKVVQIGNKTECALLDMVKKVGMNFESIRETYSNQVIHVFPFNSDRKLMGTVIRIADGGYRLFVKGASEVVLSKCKFTIGQNEKLMEMSAELHDRITNEVIKPSTSNRLRTISLAYRDFVINKTAVNEAFINDIPNWSDEINIVKNLTCLGVFGISDPIRSDVPKLVKRLQSSGITLRMVTGDDINTALSVATHCGLIESGADVAIDSTQFNRRIRDTDGIIKQHLFDEVYPTLKVLARATPLDKFNLVNGIIQSSKNAYGEVVAMIGDGDSDALALKKADVGITFGQSESDIVVKASNIILTDNKLGGVMNVVLAGRHADDSIAKFIQFILHAKLASLSITVLSMFVRCSLRINNFFYITDLVWNLLALVPLFFCDPIVVRSVQGKAYGRNKHIVSMNMLVNVIGQATYQIAVCLANAFIEVPLRPSSYYDAELVHKGFLMVSLFAIFNARSLYGERNVFRRIRYNWLLCLIGILLFCLFSYTSVTLASWGVSVVFGIGILIWQQLLFFCNKETQIKVNTSEVCV